jgi:hypothetical protein
MKQLIVRNEKNSVCPTFRYDLFAILNDTVQGQFKRQDVFANKKPAVSKSRLGVYDVHVFLRGLRSVLRCAEDKKSGAILCVYLFNSGTCGVP